jgi:hypothetical protein
LRATTTASRDPIRQEVFGRDTIGLSGKFAELVELAGKQTVTRWCQQHQRVADVDSCFEVQALVKLSALIFSREKVKLFASFAKFHDCLQDWFDIIAIAIRHFVFLREVIFELLDQYNDFQFALIEPKRGASAKLMMGETDTFFSNVRVIDREWITDCFQKK